MTHKNNKNVMFLAYESPWPTYSGGALRTMGLLKELGKSFKVDLVVLSRNPLSKKQVAVLKEYSHSILRVPLRFISLQDKFDIVNHMLRYALPYHCAIIETSFASNPHALERIMSYPGLVYASYGHWGTLAPVRAPNWILDQHNADIEFWRAVLANGFSAQYVDIVLATFVYGGASTQKSAMSRVRKERWDLLHRYFSRKEILLYGLLGLYFLNPVKAWIWNMVYGRRIE